MLIGSLKSHHLSFCWTHMDQSWGQKIYWYPNLCAPRVLGPRETDDERNDQFTREEVSLIRRVQKTRICGDENRKLKASPQILFYK